jgi:hypothetical protein
MIDWAASSDPEIRRLLESHPKVARVEGSDVPAIQFAVGAWQRAVEVGNYDLEVAGLVELMDNNPMVCADRTSVPDPLSTLPLIALGPLAWAGMILERPTLIASFEGSQADVDRAMATVGWTEGVTLHVEDRDLGTVRAATAIAAITTPKDWSEIDELYAERYSRSFFVRLDDSSAWDPHLVEGGHHAVYRLSYTPDEPTSLLTIQVLADWNGKCGAGQVVHAMNVMAGFEESQGLG